MPERLTTSQTRDDVGAPPTPRPLLDVAGTPDKLRRLDCSQLPELAEELRQEVINIVSATGGHLGAGLGAVELTVALHYAFETPRDLLIWDVSHQCYPHKVLTGRRDAMRRVRQSGGPSGFTCRTESAFDPFGAAHSSTAVSAALGMATARDLSGDNHNIVAVVGDGAMTGGMAFEGLNNAGDRRSKLIVVLNDNNMSISPPTGALARHLAELRETMPGKGERRLAFMAGRLPAFPDRPTMFDDFGMRYAGPFDGHDIEELVAVFERAKGYEDTPLFIHVVTEKGRGYAPAARAGDKYHGVGKFDVATGRLHSPVAGAPSYTSVFSRALMDEASRDERIVAVTAAMPVGTGLDEFALRYPTRFFDTGIAEQHAVTFCAGLAAEGFKPFAAIYSSFLQRAFDQVVHDVAIQRLPVRFAIDRAGMVGADGVTHQGTYDITFLGCLPGMVLMAPADEAELTHMIATAACLDERPSAVRYPRGEGTGVELPEHGMPLEIGRGRILQEGSSLAILSYGTCLQTAHQAADKLARVGLSTTLADARFAKPLDADLLAMLLREHQLLITLEEGALGGFSAQVMEVMARERLDSTACRVLPIYIPDRFVLHDTPDAQLTQAGLDADGIVARVCDLLGIAPDPANVVPIRAAE